MDSDNPPSPGEDIKIKIEPNSEGEVTKKRKKPSEKRRTQEKERQRKLRANQSEEQRRLNSEKHKWRRRVREGHPSITEEKLLELKEKYGMDIDKLREKFKPEKREEILKINAERRRKRHRKKRDANAKKIREKPGKALSKEKQEENSARKRFRAMEKRLLMTEEEKERHRMNKYLYRQVYYAKHGRYYEKSREEKDKVLARNKIWRHNLTPEGRKRYYDSIRRSYLKRKEKGTVKKQKQNTKAYWDKVKRENPERWKKHREKLNELQRKRYQRETEEERKKRRYKDKVNGVKRKLRKQLEQEGVEASEIEKRVNEVHERMWKEFDPEWTWEKYGNQRSQKPRIVESPQNTPTLSTPTELPANLETCSAEAQILSVGDALKNQNEPLLENAFFNFDDHIIMKSDGMDNFLPSPPSPLVYLDPTEDTNSQDTPSLSDHDPCPVATTFKCTFCTLEFFEDDDLRDHMRATHTDKVWMCPRCKAVVLSPQELSSHFQSVHKAPRNLQTPILNSYISSSLNFFCMRCCPGTEGIVGFPTRLELFAHVKKNHKRQSFWPCDRCLILKYSDKALEVHQTICKVSKHGSNVKRGKVKRK